jgi:NADH-quinone oxidoreductase subunit J
MITSIIFYLFAVVLLASGVMVITARNPVNAVLFLILCFFNAAGLFLLMGAEFLAFILLIVYVGAVAVLFLFVVMMLDVNFKGFRLEFHRALPAGMIVALILLTQLVFVASAWVVDSKAISAIVPPAETIQNTRALGQVLYTDTFYPFQVSGLVLLVAMVGAIVLTLRDRKGAQRQKARRQAGIAASDVVELKKVSSRKGVEL